MKIEHERRWLLPPDAATRLDLDPKSKLLEDRYLEGGYLRLRKVTERPGGETVFKLTKKYPSDSPSSRPLITLRLDEAEYQSLLALPGHDVVKTRHYALHLGHVYAIDVFAGALEGLVLSEIEAESAEELEALPDAPLAEREVTADSTFDGGRLARVGLSLQRKT